MDLQLFDTYTRTVREFEPLHPPEVGSVHLRSHRL